MRILLALLISASSLFAQADYSTLLLLNSASTPSVPAFVREDTRAIETASGSTTAIDIQSDITAGQRAVVVVQWVSASQTLSSVTDSDGNTWTIDTSTNISTTLNLAICSTVTGSTLSASDSITLNWGSAAFTFRAWALFVNSNTSAEDTEAVGGTFGTAVSASSTTSAAATIIGVVTYDNQTPTYGSGNYTTSGAAHDWGGGARRTYYVYSDQASAGSKDIGGTISTSASWVTLWTAYK